MPTKALHECNAPGCRVLTSQRFCPEHTQAHRQQYERFGRDPKTTGRYNGNWRKIRKLYIERHPLCEDCLQDNRHTPAREVHHIIPLDKGGTHEWSNLRSLCKPCHSRHTALEHQFRR